MIKESNGILSKQVNQSQMMSSERQPLIAVQRDNIQHQMMSKHLITKTSPPPQNQVPKI